MIVVKNLYKDFGSFHALQNINFCIARGDVVSLLGPNGAGKTTLMRLITGYLEPTSGTIEVSGFDIQTQRKEVLRSIGYVPENSPIYNDMNVYEFISFMSNIRNVSRIDFEIRFQELVEHLKLQSVVLKKIETLSKGFKRRVGIAGALIHKPKILILDEPTEGLDPNQKFEVRNFIKNYGKKNIVLISTHIMEEVEALSNRVILLNQGKLIRDTSPDELKKLFPENNLELAFRKITTED